MLDRSVKPQRARPHVTGPNHSDFTLHDYGLVSAQHGGWGSHGSGSTASELMRKPFCLHSSLMLIPLS